MMGDENSRCLRVNAREGFADELNLAFTDAALLEGERAGRVNAENRDAGQLDEGAQRFVDVAAIPREGRKEASKHVVERHVVIAGNAQHFMSAFAQLFEKVA